MLSWPLRDTEWKRPNSFGPCDAKHIQNDAQCDVGVSDHCIVHVVFSELSFILLCKKLSTRGSSAFSMGQA